MSKRMEFTVRLDMETAEKYRKYKKNLESGMGRISHSQAVTKIINEGAKC